MISHIIWGRKYYQLCTRALPTKEKSMLRRRSRGLSCQAKQHNYNITLEHWRCATVLKMKLFSCVPDFFCGWVSKEMCGVEKTFNPFLWHVLRVSCLPGRLSQNCLNREGDYLCMCNSKGFLCCILRKHLS